MSDQKRRFFSGNTVQQAIVQAASHYGLEPGELAYRQIEKKHGFLKVRRRAVIEVDPDDPRRAPAGAAGGSDTAAEPAGRAPAPAAPPPPRSRDAAPAPPPRGRREPPAEAEPEAEAKPEPGRGRRKPAGDEGGPAPREDRPPRGRRERGGADGGADRAAGPRRRRNEDGELVALPDSPRRLSERYPPATGPLADAAREALERILEVAGISGIEAEVLQGDDRLEIELSGPFGALFTAEEGELLFAVEHLLPRLMRGIEGDTTAVRVDCEGFHELREEQLRTLAQRTASEVRRERRPKRLQPMNPADRRIVHLTIADEPEVSSRSEGDGYLKRVRVEPE
jgi:spoIIIJ-associated protein